MEEDALFDRPEPDELERVEHAKQLDTDDLVVADDHDVPGLPVSLLVGSTSLPGPEMVNL